MSEGMSRVVRVVKGKVVKARTGNNILMFNHRRPSLLISRISRLPLRRMFFPPKYSNGAGLLELALLGDCGLENDH